MAEQLNNAENDSVQKYRLIRTAILRVVSAIVDSLTKELRESVHFGKASNPSVEVYFKLLGQKLKEVKQLDEKIQGLSTANELYEDVKTSQSFYLENVMMITSATIRNGDKEMVLQKLEELFPVFQIPSFKCTLVECNRKAAPELVQPTTDRNIDKLVSLQLHKTLLLNLEPVNRNCNNLQKFFQDMESNINALETLKVEIDSSSLVIPILDKLPVDLKRRIFKKLHFKDGDRITMDGLRNELRLELQSIRMINLLTGNYSGDQVWLSSHP